MTHVYAHSRRTFVEMKSCGRRRNLGHFIEIAMAGAEVGASEIKHVMDGFGNHARSPCLLFDSTIQ